MFIKSKDIKSEALDSLSSRKILARGGAMMTVEVSFKKGGTGALHTHPHEQISYIACGTFRYTIDGVEQVLEAGDSCYVPSGAQHGVYAISDGTIIDVFTPQRQDFLK